MSVKIDNFKVFRPTASANQENFNQKPMVNRQEKKDDRFISTDPTDASRFDIRHQLAVLDPHVDIGVITANNAFVWWDKNLLLKLPALPKNESVGENPNLSKRLKNIGLDKSYLKINWRDDLTP